MTSMVYSGFLPQQHQFSNPMAFQMHSPVYSMATTSAVPEELRCQYSSKRCENTRTNKKSGGLHKFCAVHREKANRNQMRLDHRRRVLKRMQQRDQRSHSAPSSGNNSPYSNPTKDEKTWKNAHDDDVKPEDLELDFMPLALHSEEQIFTSAAVNTVKPLFDPQDLHILEALLFSDEDQTEDDSATVPRSRAQSTTSWPSMSINV
uniref:Uncharacterized protein n=1 Tax=Globisporangium ultimum (strain ATCC 200006 / CBS 805.95 / DAOM BR144) TaxID=431595 RepID=K3X3S2_GLOUD